MRMESVSAGNWRAGIETASRQRKHLNGGQDWMSEADLDSRYDSIVLSWHLNNGKTVYRNYRTINVSELREQLDSIYENQSYKLGMYGAVPTGRRCRRHQLQRGRGLQPCEASG